MAPREHSASSAAGEAPPVAVSDFVPSPAAESASAEPAVDNTSIPSRDGVAPQALWSAVSKELTWHSIDHPRVDAHREWYQKHPAYLHRVSERAGPYLHMIVALIKERGLPMELALLPIVESAYDPFAYSHSRAAGLWQFIPGTGKEFGLHQNWWYDGRRDVVSSSKAAMRYLEQLNLEFSGDWLQALAAYNSGPSRVKRAIEYNDKQGKSVQFWDLNLPKETRHYVPKLIALAQIFSAPERYGVILADIPDQPHFGTVNTGGQIDLALAAELAAVDIDTIYQLNPGLSRWATDPAGTHQLQIPIASTNRFIKGLAALPEKERVTWSRYKIRPGDSLSRIASNHHTSVPVIQQINELVSSRIRAGDTLLIPVGSSPDAAYALSAAQRSKRQVVQGKGQRESYTVRSGDSLWSISRLFNVSTRQLAQWNGIATRDPIHPGQSMTVWRQPATLAATTPGIRVQQSKKLGYRVRRGDSLARIANKFSTTVDKLVSWNTLDPAVFLQPGQSLVVYVDVVGGK